MPTFGSSLKDKGAICLLIAALSLLVGIIVAICFAVFSRNFVEVHATVTGTEVVEKHDGDTSTFTWLEYTYEGQEYEGRIDYHSSDLVSGDPLTVTVDPDNPERVFYDGQYGLVGVFIVMAALFFIPGIIMFLMGKRIEKRRTRPQKMPPSGPFLQQT